MNPVKSLVASVLSVVGLAGASSAGAALIVSTNNNCNTLATALAGGGVTITSCSLVGALTQQGTFTGGVSSGIGIEGGVILTSGNANLSPGPNNSDSAGASTGTGSDPDLATLIPQSINDTNALSISFTTATGNLFFKYAFASEEYNEFVNSSFNDVFGFFLNGVNIAIVPGTTSTPVSINNVNCGNPYNPAGGTNCALFNNNDPTNGTPTPFNIQYDGFTDVFTASAIGLTAGVTYTIKLAIADAGDSSLDSAVFLEAGSFGGTDPNPVPEPASLALLGLALAGVGFASRRLRR